MQQQQTTDTKNTPKIIIEGFEGYHNYHQSKSVDRIIKGNTYKDLSTVCIVPVVGMQVLGESGKMVDIPVIHGRVVQNWMGLITPMNQKFIRIFMLNMKVDDAYNNAIEMIINHPELSKWKYILTLETDNMPPPDGLMKLYEAINTKDIEAGAPNGYDVVQGIYWTKGEMGQPMIYGDPNTIPINFIPQPPKPDAIQRCNGLGMGFNLFKLDMFKDPKLRKPWFKTLGEFIPGQGVKLYTQDLYFYEDAGKNGYKFACDTRTRVGHYEHERDIVW